MADDTTDPPANGDLYYVIPLRNPWFIRMFLWTTPVIFEYRDQDWNIVWPLDLKCSEGNDHVVLQHTVTVRNQNREAIPNAATDAHLLGGMVKTLNDLSPVEALIGGTSVTVKFPIKGVCRRGVILIFAIGKGTEEKLIATHDPEIKNDA